LAVVANGYILYGIGEIEGAGKNFTKEVRYLYEVNNGVKVWVNGVIRMRKFIDEY